jgi:hypothetical protein
VGGSRDIGVISFRFGASLAGSSAFSFPSTSSCPGTHIISMAIRRPSARAWILVTAEMRIAWPDFLPGLLMPLAVNVNDAFRIGKSCHK